ncbi:MAG: two-component sensor histidine kinase [Curvibacter sp. GWA2_64_110]|nr:heavy metal sensor histidine kinase [Hylemonella sp.]MDP1937195.1 heavy metal sensor histidine kinase [Hylemonella sp.]OGP03115.1 MAG: two-component sensor histidine kinase [Curvibacter sp. GWA2_64_110]HCY15455.1 two-component sensor histidine kinase [Curvibacter sp.]
MGKRHALTTRLTLLFASISTVVLLLLGLLIGEMAEHHFEELDRDLLHGKLELLQNALGKVDSYPALETVTKELQEALVGHLGLSVSVKTAQGKLIFASGEAQFPTTLLGSEAAALIAWNDSDGSPFRGMSVLAPTKIREDPYLIVAVAIDLTRHETFMASFQMALWIAVGTAAILTSFLGWVAVRRGLAPLKEMRQRAADITANRLDQRLSVASIPVELAEVAETLNGMLARLQDSFHRLSDFSSDLAHELRTPVSNLLTQTQVILSKPRSTEEYRDVLASNAEELERLSRTVADMLFLAKAENHLLIPHQEQVDLAQEVRGLLEFYEVVLEEKEISATCHGHAFISGDKLMLRRAISNLLSNAIRHTPLNGEIVVDISSPGGTQVLLKITNTGETISAEHLPRLFDRFYRVDTSRQHGGDGAGLGLPIVKSIIEAHGGTIAASSREGVTDFQMFLPKIAPLT